MPLSAPSSGSTPVPSKVIAVPWKIVCMLAGAVMVAVGARLLGWLTETVTDALPVAP